MILLLIIYISRTLYSELYSVQFNVQRTAGQENESTSFESILDSSVSVRRQMERMDRLALSLAWTISLSVVQKLRKRE